MNNKTVVKKFVCLVLGLVMIIGLALSTMAAQGETMEFGYTPTGPLAAGNALGGHITITNVIDFLEADWDNWDWVANPIEPSDTVWAVAPVTITVLENSYSGPRVSRVTGERSGCEIDYEIYEGLWPDARYIDVEYLVQHLYDPEIGWHVSDEEVAHYIVLPGATFVLDEVGTYSVFGSAQAGSNIILHVVDGNGTSPQPTPQPDLPHNLSTASTWAHDGISDAIALGLVPGNLQNHYTNNITRAEFTALAVLLYETATGREITGRVTFNDTTDVNVQKAAYIGIVSGTGDSNFSPNMQFNREQAAVIISRLAYAIGQPFPQDSAAFADNAEISSWAIEGVGQVQASGIMGGVGNNVFNPQGTFTREQSIIAILRLFEYLG